MSTDMLLAEAPPKVHSAILRLGLHYANGQVTGASARSLAMLQAFSHLIQARAL